MRQNLILLKFILPIFFLFFFKALFSQNLIPNPGFDTLEIIKTNSEVFYQYKNWSTIGKMTLRFRQNGIPDFSLFLKEASESDKLKNQKFWEPNTGNSFLYPQISYSKNLYLSKLLQSLDTSSYYKFSFFVKVLANGYSYKEISRKINNKIGFMLCDIDLSKKEILINKINLKPNFVIKKIKKTDIINRAYNSDWMLFQFIFKPQNIFNYIVVGNFTKILNEASEIEDEPIKGITYLIDDVSLEKTSQKQLVIETEDSLNTENEMRKVKDLNINHLFINKKELSHDSLINLAEFAISENKYEIAVLHYEKAFNLKSPNFKNYKNASNAINNRNIKDSLALINLDNKRQKSRDLHDIQLSNKIDSIFTLDQNCRNNNKNIENTDSLNINAILILFTKLELSEQKLGHNSFQNLHTILFHTARYPFFLKILSPLQKLLVDGKLSPRFYATLIDEYYRTNIAEDDFESYYHTNNIIALKNKLIVKVYPKNELIEINKRRKLIGLERLEIQHSLQLYNICNGYDNFEFYQIFTRKSALEESGDESNYKAELENQCNCNLKILTCN